MDHHTENVVTPALYALVRSLDAFTQQLKQEHDCQRVTKQDLRDSEARIIAAFKNLDPAELAKLVKAGNNLDTQTSALDAAVKNQTK